VVFIEPDRLLRMQGGLGPLQSMAVSGSMTFTLDEDGSATRLRYHYSVGGWAPEGLQQMAAPVDQVQLGQLLRLKRYIETGSPTGAAQQRSN
jgi:hypothetical protein